MERLTKGHEIMAVYEDSVQSSKSSDLLLIYARKALIVSNGSKEALVSEIMKEGRRQIAHSMGKIVHLIADSFEVESIKTITEIELPNTMRLWLDWQHFEKKERAQWAIRKYLGYCLENSVAEESPDSAIKFIMSLSGYSTSTLNVMRKDIQSYLESLSDRRAKKFKAGLSAIKKAQKAKKAPKIGGMDSMPELVKQEAYKTAIEVADQVDRMNAAKKIAASLLFAGFGMRQVTGIKISLLIDMPNVPEYASRLYYKHQGQNYKSGADNSHLDSQAEYYGRIKPDRPILSETTLRTYWKLVREAFGAPISYNM